MVEKLTAIRDAYKAEERALEEKLAKVRSKISMFNDMIAEEGGLATATPVQPPEQPVAVEEVIPAVAEVVEEKKESEIIEIRL